MVESVWRIKKSCLHHTDRILNEHMSMKCSYFTEILRTLLP